MGSQGKARCQRRLFLLLFLLLLLLGADIVVIVTVTIDGLNWGHPFTRPLSLLLQSGSLFFGAISLFILVAVAQ